MKRINKLFAIFSILALLLAGFTKIASAKENDKEYISVINQNIRTVASDTASPVTYLPEGEKVEYLRETKKNWFEVKYDGKTGYVDRGDLTSEENYNNSSDKIYRVETEEEANADSVYIAPVDVNLRSKNVRNGSSLALIKQGEKVVYKGTTDNDWFLVEYKEKEGYVHRSNLTSEKGYNEGNREYEKVSLNEEKGLNELEVIIAQSLRVKDTRNYASIMSLSRGDVVNYKGTTAKNWFLVEYKGTKGYIYRGDVTALSKPDNKPDDKPVEKPDNNPDEIIVSKPNGLEYVTTNDLNLRKGNTTSYGIATVIPKKGTVKHLGTADNGWYKVDYNGIIGFVSSSYLKEKKSVKGAMVFMDYGHGGFDPGAIGLGGRREKDDTLRLGLLITKKLRAQGVLVDEFRDSDPNRKLTLWDRTNMANKKNYDYFVSIHRNSFNGIARGVETFSHKNSSQKSKDLSSQIQKNLVNLGFIDRKAKHANFHVLRETKAPAVLVEAGFIDNQKDNSKFDSKLNEIASAISKGITTEIKRNK